MTDRLDRLVGDAVRDLAGGADVISDRDRRLLALHASDRAHTLRRRRWAASAAAVLMAAALAAGIPYGIKQLDTGPAPPARPTGAPAAPPGVETIIVNSATDPIELVDNWYVGGNRAILDRSTGLYTPFRARTVIPSPTGRWVATDSGNGAGIRIYDLTDSSSHLYQTRLLGEGLNSGEWSPDGSTLLVTGMIMKESTVGAPAPTTIGAGLIDADREEIIYHEIALPELSCVYCVLTWMPSGTEVALVLGAEAGLDDVPVTGIALLELGSGNVRTVPVAGVPAGTGAWSPDGELVIVASDRVTRYGPSTERAQIVEVATGEVVGSLPGIELKQAQWIDNDRFLTWAAMVTGEETTPSFRAMASLWTRDGELLQRWVLPIEVVELGPGPAAAPLAVRLG